VGEQAQTKLRGVADIAFLIDCSASMQPCIDQLKASVGDFCQQLSSGNPVAWRARAVGFRDREVDGSEWVVGEDHKLVETEADLRHQLEAFSALGGGDAPESGLDALWIVAHETDWRPLGQAHRLIVLLTDAPPKNPMNAATVSPGQPNDVYAVGQYLAEQHIKVLLWAPQCAEWDLTGKVPGSQLNNVAAGGDVYDGLRNVKFPEVYKTIAKTVSVPVSGRQ
jgi:von Willebrand factor type A domain